MALLVTVGALAVIAFVLCWPHIFVRDEHKREFVGSCIAIPLLLIVVAVALVLSRACS
jgi:hypothetical protein